MRSDLEAWLRVIHPFWAVMDDLVDLVDNTGSVISDGDGWPDAMARLRKATWAFAAYPASDWPKVKAKERAAVELLHWGATTYEPTFENCAEVILASIGQTLEPWAFETETTPPPVRATWPVAAAFWAAAAVADPARNAPLRVTHDSWGKIGRTAFDALITPVLTPAYLGEKAQIAAWLGALKLQCSAAAAGEMDLAAECHGAFERIYSLAPETFTRALADPRTFGDLSKEVARSRISGLGDTHFIRVMIGLSIPSWRRSLWNDLDRLRSYGFEVGQPGGGRRNCKSPVASLKRDQNKGARSH